MASQRVDRFSHRSLWRIVTALLISFIVLTPAVAEARVPRAYAGIVLDAKTGKVLYSSDADEYRYPASVTKVMTLYILFQELSAGHIKLSDKMPVSKWAASAVPTKLGLRAGSTITVDNAIKSIVTISANDMARVIAEYIGGSESAFAKRMTATAHALGMKHTTYVNASGLPDGRQITTVRDQALLGAAIFEHYPQYYHYFQVESFKYGKRTYRGHDHLLGHNGVDGLKTGYTGASGYNLLTAARKDGKHIVVAGFGFASSGKRDAKVRDLVDTYLPKAHSGDYYKTAMIPLPGRKGSPLPDNGVRVAAVPVPMPIPTFRAIDGDDAVVAPDNPQSGIGDVDTDLAVASLAPEPIERPVDLGMPPALQAVDRAAPQQAPARRTLDQVVGAFTDTYTLGAAPAPLGQTRASAPLIPPVGIGDEGQPVDLMTSGSISSEAAVFSTTDAAPQSLGIEPADARIAEAQPRQQMPAPLPQGWVVQIGAAPTEGGANGLLADAAGKVHALGRLRSFVERFEKDGQVYFRARFGGFSGQDAATDMCKQLKQAKMSCLAMQS